MSIELQYYDFGHPAISVQDGKGNILKNYYVDTGEPTTIRRKCPQCHKMETKEGHDPCIANLPGVEHACCGHGTSREAYVKFTDGKVIRGEFDIDYGY